VMCPNLFRPRSVTVTHLQLVELCRLLDLEEYLGSVCRYDLDV
jgi:hypothetical protein